MLFKSPTQIKRCFIITNIILFCVEVISDSKQLVVTDKKKIHQENQK
jgi:hypothetical protein